MKAGKWSCYRLGTAGQIISFAADRPVATHGLSFREAREVLAYWAGAASQERDERVAFALRFDVLRADKDDFMPLPFGRKGRRARDGEWILQSSTEDLPVTQYLVMEEDGRAAPVVAGGADAVVVEEGGWASALLRNASAEMDAMIWEAGQRSRALMEAEKEQEGR